MKQTDSRFLTAVQRVCTVTIVEKLPLYFLVLIGIGLTTSCHWERDIYDLAEETLLIYCLTADESSLNLQEITTITAEVYYSGKPTELLPKWTATKGEIYNNGKAPMDVTRRKHKDTDRRVRMTATYVAPAQIDTETNTDKITFEVGNRGIIVSSAIIVKIINPVTMSDSANGTSTQAEATPKPKEEENDTAEDEAAAPKPKEND